MEAENRRPLVVLALGAWACAVLAVACSQSTTGASDGGNDGVGDGPRGERALGDGPRSERGSGDGPLVKGDGVDPGCTGCHGSTANLAPPLSVTGKSATTERGVGAHQQHLVASTWHAPIQCTDCHIVPKKVTDPGHIDTALPAELTWSALATSDGAKPAWDGVKCSGTYCHGSTLSGGTATAPVWTKVDGTQSACGSCHSLPPTGGGHTTNTNCSACHGAVVDASRKIIAPALHIDGKVQASGGHPAGWGAGSVHGPAFLKDTTSCGACHGATLTGGTAKSCETCHGGWKTNCTFCHGGTDNKTGAPPAAVDGQVATTVHGVGRHTSHVTATATHAAYACNVCHKMPTDALTPGHIDPSPAEVIFSGLGAGATYTYASTQCSNVYCHGNGKSGGGGGALWVGSLSGGCGACHATSSLGGHHSTHLGEGYGCSTCHSCVVNSSMQIVDPTKHVNGSRDVCSTTRTLSWTGTGCTPSGCHGQKTW
jgi:predicted CxxxxCH...CXXCH cytochrome family protein